MYVLGKNLPKLFYKAIRFIKNESNIIFLEPKF